MRAALSGADPADPAEPRAALLGNANFRWLLGGGLISILGDQFTLIALPWLVLQLSGDTLALGLVLAVMSVPRAVFILVGGAVVDRHSPTRVLMLAKLAQCVLLAALALTLHVGALRIWMVYGFALGLGLATAFSYPAGSAMLPRCLPPQLLRPANSLLMGLSQLVALLGPVLAGAVIACFHDAGLALSFGFDALTFALSAVAVMQLRLTRLPQAPAAPSSIRQDIATAARAFWADVPLRTVCLYFAAIAFFVGGPISVALPVLAKTQLPGGAAALGWLLMAHGLGVLAGMTLSGLRPGWRLGSLGRTMLAIDTVAGLAFLPFGHITATWQGMAMLAPMGALMGFVQVAVFSWMQKRVPPAMLGRTMSLFLFIIMGLAPLASAAAGAALRVLSPAVLFTLSGAMLLVIVAVGALLTPIRDVSDA
jgi:hypothetical protein